ncbi:MAG: NAD(P)H-dependent glycerol-3-phosphate dehydrogenase [Bacilli bacterium]|nr:NAD(P)H-dependent glycerol-3-phosphate dehydrogenase [Bacilli bacterium]
MNIAIIGSGSFGCVLSKILSEKNNVKIWSYLQEEADMINNEHKCMFIKDLVLDESIKASTDYQKVIEDSNIIVLVTPSRVIRETCKNIKNFITNQEIVLLSKGMEDEKLLSEVIFEELGKEPSVISGPSHAEQLSRDIPTYVMYSGNKELKEIFETDYFHLTYTDDSIGMQLGAALKNIISLGSGIVEGLGYESNTLSYFITEGLREINEISVKMGAKTETIYGLAGLGDLLTTSLSMDSRNKRAGLLLAKGKSIEEVRNEIGMTIEGLDSLKSGYKLAKKYNIEAKIINNLYDIIYNEKDVKTILK